MPERLTMAVTQGLEQTSLGAEYSVLVAAVVLGLSLVGFGVRQLVLGRYRDEETARRGATRLIGMWARQYFSWLTQPLVSAVLALRVPPSAVTLLSIPLAIGAGAAIGAGHLAAGAWLLIGSSICDYLDGRLARAMRMASPAGAMLDSVVDRFVEAALYIGLAWLYREDWVLLVVLVAFLGSLMVPYARARAEALGVPMDRVGIVQRPERIVILTLVTLASPAVEAVWPAPSTWPHYPLLVAGLVFLAITTHISATQRIVHAVYVLRGRPMRLMGRSSVARSVIAAVVATAADFAVVVLLRHTTPLSAAAATLCGCGIGGVTNFFVNRAWTYCSHEDAGVQAGRYVTVSTGSAFLNSGLVALLSLYPHAPFLVVWWSVRLLVFLTWNYPLHREFVFAKPREPDEALAGAATRP